MASHPTTLHLDAANPSLRDGPMGAILNAGLVLQRPLRNPLPPGSRIRAGLRVENGGYNSRHERRRDRHEESPCVDERPGAISLFDVFGPQIMSVNGNDWQRHRKVTGAAFKEENARAVWYASLRQAEAWSKVIASRQGEDVITLAKATELTHVVALHVLSAGGFGRECDFEKGTTQPEEGHSMSYGQSLSVIMQNILMTAILFSALKLPRIILPAALKKLSIAVDEFGKYMKERVEDVKQGALSDLTVKGNLMSALVEANESEKQEAAKGTSTGSFLTDEEMYGNLFMYNVAGYETTANALAFALPLLAGYPKVQEWVFEEVSEVFETGGDEVTYEDGFPKLVRTLAIMVSFVID